MKLAAPLLSPSSSKKKPMYPSLNDGGEPPSSSTDREDMYALAQEQYLQKINSMSPGRGTKRASFAPVAEAALQNVGL